jgi:HEPN domain-containing protein
MDRIEDAKVLLDAGRWSAAYYIAGYAAECALKACILGRIDRTGIVFTEKRFQEKCWTHSLEELVKQAGLDAELGMTIAAHPAFGVRWSIVKAWNELSRYGQSPESDARELFDALVDDPDGILKWLQIHW